MQPINFDSVLERIAEDDPRYRIEGYIFVREALDHTQKQICKQKNQIRHVSGQELLEGIREFALAQFGPMTATVLNEWGIRRCEDFGEIVFNMVEHGLLNKTENDTRDDFKGGYDFQTAFATPFVPESKKAVPPAESKPAET